MLEESHNFDPEIKKIENEIIDFFIDIGEFWGRSKKTTIIYAHFLIRKRLTQEILRNLTNFSAGTISTSLSELVQSGNILVNIYSKKSKEYFINLNNQIYLIYTYVSKPPSKDELKQFFDNYLVNSNKIKNNFERTHFLKKIRDLAFYSPISLNSQQSRRNFQDLSWLFENPISQNYHFSKEFVEVETKFTNKMLQMNYFQESDEKIAWIQCLFFMREILDIPTIMEITHYSHRTIKNRLKLLVDIDFIKADSDSKYYILRSLTKGMTDVWLKYIIILGQYQVKFQDWIKKLANINSHYNILIGQEYILSHLVQVNSLIENATNYNKNDPLFKYFSHYNQKY